MPQPAEENTYRLVGVVSHRGSATNSGHYVSHVYSLGRDCWLEYDDWRVSSVHEAEIMRDVRQSGYVFIYQHKDRCSGR